SPIRTMPPSMAPFRIRGPRTTARGTASSTTVGARRPWTRRQAMRELRLSSLPSWTPFAGHHVRRTVPECPGPHDASSVKVPAQLAVQPTLVEGRDSLDSFQDDRRCERLAEDAQQRAAHGAGVAPCPLGAGHLPILFRGGSGTPLARSICA